MAAIVNINGELWPPEQARVSVFDRGFLYGDSVYETVRTYRGRCFMLPEHLSRLQRSAQLIGLELPGASDQLGREVERTVAAADNPESAIRITVTRGEGPVGIDPRTCRDPTTVIIARPLDPLPEALYHHGVRVVVARTVRNSPRALNPNIKSGNFLNNILAVREAIAADAFEAVMLTHEGNVAEATQSNIFAVRGGVVLTPGGDADFLRGITRGLVLELCHEDHIEARERDMFVSELYEADELFLTSTLKGVLPITGLGRRAVGDGKPGPTTRRIAALYDTRTRADGRTD